MRKQSELLRNSKRRRFPGGRVTAVLLCLCLILTLLPATALAGEEQNDGTGAEPGAGCICTGLCGEESVNKDCPVCSVEGIDLTVCQGEETQPDTPETLTEAPTDVTESSQEGLGTEDVIITDDSEGVETEGTEGTEETETEELASGCICTELCTGDNINGECPLCGAGGADLTACKGVESQPDTQAKAAPARAITPRIAYDILWIGNTLITDSGYWTTDGNGNLMASDAGNYNIAFDADTNTLTLNNANIAGQYDFTYNNVGAGIWAYSRSGAVSLNIQVTGNNVVSGSIGIYALSNGGEVSVTISGGGSLTASGSLNGISIVSEFSSAALAIEGTALKASGSYGDGVQVQAGESSSGSLSVNGGSLTASGNTGIYFHFSAGVSGSGIPSLTVAGNAVVDAKSGGIAHNSSNNLSIQGNSGIVFNGSTGTVYGNASLQDDLIIGEGERLILDNGANLDANGHNVIVDGGTLDEGIKNSLGDSVKYTPTITTTSLPNGTAEAAYSTTLLAEGTAPITWSVTSGSLPEGLSLDASTGVISGTPTAEGGSAFIVEAANDYGFDSREFTLSIDKPVVIPVTGVKLDKTSLTLQETDSATLTATVEPDNATNKNVNWESSDTSIATVDASGKVTAISAGTATITVKTEDYSQTATCKVTVYGKTLIATHPSDTAVTEGKAAVFSVSATGSNLAYQWQESTDKGDTWKNITGADSSSYTIASTAMSMNGNQYRCTVTGAGGTAASNAATLTVNPAQYTVTVETDGHGTASVSPVSAAAGAEIRLTAYPDSGYRFKQWEVVSGGITITGDTFTMPASNVTVKAIFERRIITTYYTLTFDANGGTELPSISRVSGSIVDLSGYKPVREGCTFTGWYADAGLTQKITEIRMTSSKTVYAGWTYDSGAVIEEDGTVILPGADLESTEDDTRIEKGEGEPPVYHWESVSVTINEGNIVTLPSGIVITPAGGSVVAVDGTVTEPDGTVIHPDGRSEKPDGTVIDPDGTTHNPDGSVQSPDGTYLAPGTPVLERAEVHAAGNQVRAVLAGESAGAQGYDYVISENINCINDKDYLQVSKNIEEVETYFRYVPEGTYYVYCHAWLKDESGRKVFSSWSEGKAVEVTAVTPGTPKIQNVRVNQKAKTITVTYTRCENASGYDIILGSRVEKVNGERRPVDYGKRVKKVTKGNTVTVTLRNAKKGTYYMALHAWNRTSENRTKVFSPWSNIKRIVIK